jgi:hypothetical protein
MVEALDHRIEVCVVLRGNVVFDDLLAAYAEFVFAHGSDLQPSQRLSGYSDMEYYYS